MAQEADGSGMIEPYATVARTMPRWVLAWGHETALCYWEKGMKRAAYALAMQNLRHRMLWLCLPGYRQWYLERTSSMVSNWFKTLTHHWWPHTRRVWFSAEWGSG